MGSRRRRVICRRQRSSRPRMNRTGTASRKDRPPKTNGTAKPEGSASPSPVRKSKASCPDSARTVQRHQMTLATVLDHAVETGLIPQPSTASPSSTSFRAPASPLKSNNARRMIPIHSQLLDLGFMELVDRQRRIGEKRLFPRAHPRQDREVELHRELHQALCQLSPSEWRVSRPHGFPCPADNVE